MRSTSLHPTSLNSVLFGIVGLLMLGLAIAGIARRADVLKSNPGRMVDPQLNLNKGFQRFHDEVYFPVRGLLSGVNPYSKDFPAYHPDGKKMGQQFPSSLFVHAPFGFLQLPVAESAYLVCNLLIVLVVVGLLFRLADHDFSVGGICLVSALILVCRPGLLNFLGLHMTMIHVLGCLLALEFAKRNSVLSGVGLLLSSSNLAFAIPLSLIMLCRRNVAALACGAALLLGTSALVIAIAGSKADGFDASVRQVTRHYLQFLMAEPVTKVDLDRIDVFSVLPELNPAYRNRTVTVTDLLSRVGDEPDTDESDHLLATLRQLPAERVLPWLLLLLAGLVTLIEANRDQRVCVLSRTGVFALLVVLISVYHQTNDALLLWIPLMGLALGARRLEAAFSRPLRWLLIILLLIPLFNFVGTEIVLEQLNWAVDSKEWKVAVTIDSLAIGAAGAIVGLRMMLSPLFSSDRVAMDVGDI